MQMEFSFTPPPMYNQEYVDTLLAEIEYYKKLYREYLIKFNEMRIDFVLRTVEGMEKNDQQTV